MRRVTGLYFSTVRPALRRGELFAEVEPQAATGAVINEATAMSRTATRLVLGYGARLTAIGIVLGVARAFALTLSRLAAVRRDLGRTP